MKDIAYWRDQIDALENALIDLVNQRAACALEIGKIKHEQGLPVFDSKREDEILERVASKSKGVMPPASMQRIFLTLMEETRKIEEF